MRPALFLRPSGLVLRKTVFDVFPEQRRALAERAGLIAHQTDVPAKPRVGEGDAIPKLFIPKLIEYYKDGLFPFDRLLKFYPFEEINRAFKESHEGKCIKAVLTME